MDKALAFFEHKDLPTNWDRDELLGSDVEFSEDESESSDDEPNEEKDRFVAQLYKFMDDRGKQTHFNQFCIQFRLLLE